MRRRLALSLLLIVAGVYAGLCLLVYLTQERLVYFPGPRPGSTPAAYGLDYRELSLVPAPGVQLQAWWLPAPGQQAGQQAGQRGALLFCHGNAGNIEHRLPAARVFMEMGLSVLLFDYRGYGGSTGQPSEEGTYADAEAAYEFLIAEGLDPARIVLYGESLGAGVALELARRRAVAGVFVESAFTSLPDLGAEVYWWLPVRLLTRFHYANEDKIGRLGVPVLVAHSSDDEIIPATHGQRLLSAAREPKTFLATRGGHNDGGFLQRPEWIEGVEAFIGGLLP